MMRLEWWPLWKFGLWMVIGSLVGEIHTHTHTQTHTHRGSIKSYAFSFFLLFSSFSVSCTSLYFWNYHSIILSVFPTALYDIVDLVTLTALNKVLRRPGAIIWSALLSGTGETQMASNIFPQIALNCTARSPFIWFHKSWPSDSEVTGKCLVLRRVSPDSNSYHPCDPYLHL